MAEQLERARRKRAPIRAATTRLLQRLESELEETSVNKHKIQGLLAQLEDKEETLSRLDTEIEPLIAEDLLEDEMAVAEEYRERVILWKRMAVLAIEEQDGSGRSSPYNASSYEQRENSREMTIKLPRLTIEKYNGDSCTWQTFWSQFKSAIHDNKGLNQVDKFNYLKAYLEGAAADAVSGLALTSENYEVATDILLQRFGRRDIVINAHMNKLLSLPAVRQSSNIKGLRQLYDACALQIRSLQSLGVVSEAYGTLLCPILMKLLPEDIAIEYSRKRETDDDWDVSNLLEFLRREVESRERALTFAKLAENEKGGGSPGGASGSSYKGQQKENKHTNNSKPKPNLTAAALTASAQTVRCIFCNNDNHESGKCTVQTMSKKREVLVTNRRCFVCMKQGHQARFCRSKKRCGNCGRRHHTVLCEQGEASRESENKTSNDVVSSVAQAECKRDTVFLQTALVAIEKEKNTIIARCILDGGSQRSFIREDLSRKLNLPVLGTENITLHTFGSNTPKMVVRRRDKLSLMNVHNRDLRIEIEALETPQVCTALIQLPNLGLRQSLEQKGFQLADGDSTKFGQDENISLLIGADYYWRVVKTKVEKIGRSLMAIDSLFGWTLHGPMPVSTEVVTGSVGVMKVFVQEHETEEELLSKRIKAFWELDSMGITENGTSAEDNLREKTVMTQFENNILFKGDRYEVGLPWKGEAELTSDNYTVAEKRLNSLMKRFIRDPVYYHRYSEVIHDYINKGIVEPVNEKDPSCEKKIFYLPHHGVVREDKTTTTLRVVLDGSAHEKGHASLNDLLEVGPNLIPDLLCTLLRFRTYKVAFVADIEKAFLQIALKEDDRDVIRFLWFDGPPSLEKTPRVFRFTRVLFGVNSSPFLLSATIKHHIKNFEQSHPETYQLLEENLYMDDLLGGAQNETDAFKRSEKAKNILCSAGMSLRKWQSNSPELMSKWSREFTTSSTTKSFQTQECTGVKVLGLVWHRAEDVFSFDVEALTKLTVGANTKREVLQVTARIFDPLGLLTPFVIVSKCMHVSRPVGERLRLGYSFFSRYPENVEWLVFTTIQATTSKSTTLSVH